MSKMMCFWCQKMMSKNDVKMCDLGHQKMMSGRGPKCEFREVFQISKSSEPDNVPKSSKYSIPPLCIDFSFFSQTCFWFFIFPRSRNPFIQKSDRFWRLPFTSNGPTDLPILESQISIFETFEIVNVIFQRSQFSFLRSQIWILWCDKNVSFGVSKVIDFGCQKVVILECQKCVFF